MSRPSAPAAGGPTRYGLGSRAPAAALLAAALLCMQPAAPCLAQSRAGEAVQSGQGYDLGAVIDVRRASADGLRVMAVTPGGAADRVGLRAGDLLQVLNRQPLTGDLRPAAALEQAVRAGGGVLDVQLVRDGRPMSLSGALDPRRASGATGCGQVNDRLDGLPAVSDVRRVDVTQIEGRGVSAPSSGRHSVAAGTRVVIVREHVPPRPTRPLSTYASKAMVLDIEVGHTYFVGARPTGGGTWQPFVWQTLKEPCR